MTMINQIQQENQLPKEILVAVKLTNALADINGE